MVKPNADNPVSGLSILIPRSVLVQLLTDWVLADIPETPETMDRIYQSVARSTLARLLAIEKYGYALQSLSNGRPPRV